MGSWTLTCPASLLVPAVKAVLPAACTDDTLPVLCGVHAAARDHTVTLTTTNRKIIARRVIESEDLVTTGVLDGNPWQVVISAAAAKEVTRLKAYDRSPVTLTVDADGSYVLEHSGMIVRYPAEGPDFPRTHRFFTEFRPGAAPPLRLDARLLERITKTAPGREDYVTFTQPAGSGPVKWETGETSGFIVPIREPPV